MSSSSIRIRRYEELPTAKDFDSLIESTNAPAVFCGCTKDWKAFSHWNPSNGGLDYLQARVGSCMVEAMISQSAPVFYGDLGSHQRVPLPFSSFLDFCKKRLQMKSKHQQCLDHCPASQTHHDTQHAYLALEDVPEQIYLAQVSIMNSDHQEHVQLETLREDIQMPPILASKELSSVNMWMNNAQARSSTHYDPHHNLLCIVSGCKQVVLWPPSSSPSLYPMPIYGEASNHSTENILLKVNCIGDRVDGVGDNIVERAASGRGQHRGSPLPAARSTMLSSPTPCTQSSARAVLHVESELRVVSSSNKNVIIT